MLVLEGDLIIEGEVCYQGDYIRSVQASTHLSLAEGDVCC
ncbi:hypothetical protein [Tychonema sp. LEGE 07203]